jgi:hypothetical protein
MSELASSSPTLVAAERFDPLNGHDLAQTRPYYHPDVVEDLIAVGQSRGIDAALGVFSMGKPLFQVEREDLLSGPGGHSQDDRGDDASWRVRWPCQ